MMAWVFWLQAGHWCDKPLKRLQSTLEANPRLKSGVNEKLHSNSPLQSTSGKLVVDPVARKKTSHTVQRAGFLSILDSKTGR